MKNLPLIYLVFLTFLSCSRESEDNKEVNFYIPKNSSHIIQTSNLKGFLNQVDSLSLFRDNGFLLSSSIKESLNFLASQTKPEKSVICFSRNENKKVQFLFISKDQPENFILDSIGNRSMETFKYESFEIKKYEVEGTVTFTAVRNKIFFGSNSRRYLEQILSAPENEKSNDEVYTKIQNAADENKTSIFLNHSELDSILTELFPATVLPINSLADWSVLEPDFVQNELILNGISTWAKDSKSLLKIFAGVGTQTNEIAKLTPTSAAGFYSFSYNNFAILHKNLNIYRKTQVSFSENHILNYSGEAGLIFFNNNSVFVLKTTDPHLANEALNQPGEVKADFRGYNIFYSESLEEITKPLQPLVSETDFSYYVWLDQFLVLGKNIETLQVIIFNSLNNTTLWGQEYYNTAMNNLAGASSLLLVANSAEIKPALQSSSAEAISAEIDKLNLKDYPVIALQFVEDNDFAHIHGVFSTTKQATQNSVKQLKSFNLDAAPGTPAFLVKNQVSGQVEVAVQDEENAFYLFDLEGNRLWKKPQAGRINDRIFQVDISKNGNLQMVFTTSHSLQILDRKGNAVNPFPIEFKDEITEPLSIFDYDNNRTYRFVIVQNNNVLMYDSKGKIVKGFDFDKTSSAIKKAPEHFRINNKDYILFPEENGKLNILSRQGKSRITVKENIDFSENDWYAYKNKFISSTEGGAIITVDENGKVSKQTAVGGNLMLAADKNNLITLQENILKVNEKEINLDYGLYTKPQIHKSNGKVYISVTDTQANRVFLFDNQANLIEGFPVYGNSEIEMAAGKNGSNIISVRGEGEEIIIYHL